MSGVYVRNIFPSWAPNSRYALLSLGEMLRNEGWVDDKRRKKLEIFLPLFALTFQTLPKIRCKLQKRSSPNTYIEDQERQCWRVSKFKIRDSKARPFQSRCTLVTKCFGAQQSRVLKKSQNKTLLIWCSCCCRAKKNFSKRCKLCSAQNNIFSSTAKYMFKKIQNPKIHYWTRCTVNCMWT